MSRIEKALKKAIEQQGRVRNEEASSQVLPSNVHVDSSEVSSNSGSIPSMSTADRSLSVAERASLKIISPELNQAPAVKAFRELRTKIGQRVAPGAVIMVTGVLESSGSTFVATNLATAIAFDSTRTALLVDCHLRDPQMGRLLFDPAVQGLTDYLEDEQAGVADVIHPTGIERLRVVPVGRKPSEHSEYFTLDKTKRLIEELASRYPDRQIILDAPPMASSADAQILMTFCDHVLVVVPYGRATEADLQSALKLIDPSKLLGVVLNDEPTVPSFGFRQSVRLAMAVLMDKFRALINRGAATGKSRQ